MLDQKLRLMHWPRFCGLNVKFAVRVVNPDQIAFFDAKHDGDKFRNYDFQTSTFQQWRYRASNPPIPNRQLRAGS